MQNKYDKWLSETFSLFQNIKDVSSTNKKADLLFEHSDNFILKSMLYLTYNPFLMYNIKKIPAFSKSKDNTVDSKRFEEFTELLKNLSDRNITGNDALNAVSKFLSKCSKQEQEWYPKVLQKDLKIGLADKGINKVFKDLIPVYEVLLADKIPADSLNLDTSKAIKMLPKRVVCQPKLDGFRLNIFVYDDQVCIRTRNGKIISGYNELEKEALEKLPAGYVYDGEMMSVEFEDYVQANISSGEYAPPDRQMFLDAVSHAFSKEDNKKGIFNLFDMVKMVDWESGIFTDTLEKRYERIANEIVPIHFNTIKVVETSRVFHTELDSEREAIVNLFHYYLSVGYEGLMIKNFDALYQFKRTKDLLKMKLMLSEDLEVVEVYEGNPGTKYEGILGGVYVNYTASDGNTYKVGVGSGWTDDERLEYGRHPERIIGKIIEVTYQSETQNKDGGYSLSFPVKKDIRLDK